MTRGWMLLPALLLAACGTADEDRLRRNEVLLQVSATGRSEARPDEARLTIGVSNNGATAAAASRANNLAMIRVTQALAQLGVQAGDVQTRNLSLQRIDYGPQRGQFRAENLVEVRVRDVGRAGEAVAAATEAGGNVVAGPSLRLSSPEAADNLAYAAAYKAARARAETYAAAAGLKVQRVLTIRDGGVPGGLIPYVGDAAMREEAAAQAASAAPPVSAGTTTREVRVRVDFALAK